MPRPKPSRIVNSPSLLPTEQVPTPKEKGCIGLDIPLPRVSPIFEQVTLSVLFPIEPTDFLREHFGNPTFWSKSDYMWYEAGFFLSKKPPRRRRILLKPEERVTSVLYPVLEGLQTRLSSADIAFDIPLDDIQGDTQAEATLLELATVILPKAQLSNLTRNFFTDGRDDAADDSVISSGIVFDIKKIEENKNGEHVYADCDLSWRARLSLMQFGGPPWFLRIMVTLPKPELSKYGIKELPQDFHVNNEGQPIKIDNFFTFARFDWERFACASVNFWDTSPEAVQNEYRKLMRAARNNTSVIADMLSAYRIAKVLGATDLEQRVQDGEFLSSIKVFEG